MRMTEPTNQNEPILRSHYKSRYTHTLCSMYSAKNRLNNPIKWVLRYLRCPAENMQRKKWQIAKFTQLLWLRLHNNKTWCTTRIIRIGWCIEATNLFAVWKRHFKNSWIWNQLCCLVEVMHRMSRLVMPSQISKTTIRENLGSVRELTVVVDARPLVGKLHRQKHYHFITSFKTRTCIGIIVSKKNPRDDWSYIWHAFIPMGTISAWYIVLSHPEYICNLSTGYIQRMIYRPQWEDKSLIPTGINLHYSD